jgi:type I restriction enzyme S subunit
MSGPTPARLGDLAEFINGDRGVNYPSRSDFADEGVPFINAGHLTDGQVDFSEMNFISEDRFHKLGSGKTKKNDLLYCLRGSLGKAAIVRHDRDAAIASSLVIIRPGERCSVEYLYRYLTSPFGTAEIRRFDTGSSQPNLSAASVKKYQIPLPPLAEQRRIAAILDAADELRAKRRKSLAQLDTLLQSTFLDMFGDPVTNPMGWDDSVPLGEVSDIVSGLTKGRKLKAPVTREVPYLAVVNVQDRQLVLDPVKRIDATENEIRKYRLVDGDLLLTEGGDPDKLGRGTVWRGEIDECIHQNHIFRVRITDARIRPVFLSWLVGSPRGKRYFLRQSKQTTGIATINITQLRKFPLLLPRMELQDHFTTVVESIEQHKERLRVHLAELDALFASLQSRAFRGEL